MKKLIIFLCLIHNYLSYSQEGFRYPVTGTTVKTNCFFNNGCAQPSKKHTGLDFMSSNGFDIYSVASGKIEKIIEYGKNCNNQGTGCDDHGLGNTVIISHKKKNGGVVYSQYSHLDAFATGLTLGMVIPKGFYLGKMGASGQNCRTYWCNTNCTSAPGCSNTHLHFELKNSPIVGAPDGSANYGYTPNLAENYGYSDPYIFLSNPNNGDYQILPHVLGNTFTYNTKFFDWADIVGASNYRIQVKKATSTGWTAENGFTSGTGTTSEIVINTATGTTSQYSATISLEYSTTYYWTVRVSNNNNSSFYCPIYSFITPPPPSCNPPTSISSSNITSNSAKINWALDANNTTNIILEYKVSGTAWPGTVLTLPANYYYNTLNNLKSKTTYVYRLKRNCTGGSSSNYSAEYNFTTATQCSSNANYSTTSGTITDGSGSYDYESNLNCSWIINPTGVAAINIKFTAFNTESCCDKIYIKNNAGTILYTFSGSSLPSPITVPGNYVKVEFVTDGSVVSSGWSLDYSSIMNNGIYKLTHKGTNQCLDVYNNNNQPENVQQCDDNGTTAQQWVLTLETGGFFKLKHKGTDLCLDVNDNSNDNGIDVRQWWDNGNDAQRWKIELQSDGAYKLTHKGTSPAKCLDAVNNGNWCGVDVIQYQDNGNDAQRWYLTYIGQNLQNDNVQSRSTNKTIENNYSWTISPNPANAKLMIKSTAAYEGNLSFSLFDLSGQQIRQWDVLKLNNDNTSIDISEINDGLYILKNHHDNSIRKIMISH